MNKAWRIIFADGSSLDGLGLSGNNFVSDAEVTEATFEGKLSGLTIEAPEGSGLAGMHAHMKLERIAHYEGVRGLEDGWYFVLRDLSDLEVLELKLRGDIEYIAMATGIDLE